MPSAPQAATSGAPKAIIFDAPPAVMPSALSVVLLTSFFTRFFSLAGCNLCRCHVTLAIFYFTRQTKELTDTAKQKQKRDTTNKK